MVALSASVAALLLAAPINPACAGDRAKPIQIGISNTFFQGLPKAYVKIAADDFKGLFAMNGLNGEFTAGPGPMDIAEKLHAKKLDFGILHAHELAWALQKYPDLRPLLITVNKQYDAQAFLIVHKNSSVKTMADLRGKNLDMPFGTKEYCRLFLEKDCTDKGSAAFFGTIEQSASRFEALDRVARDKVQATIVDTEGLESYKEIKGPVFAKNLKVLLQSEVFPPSVIVYEQGAVDKNVLRKFQDALLKAHKFKQGRETMKRYHIDAFEAIPKEYSKRLDDIQKRYPTPISLP
jgi:ABC-type phosphate/phosphonate transport system substrate-binding protein